MTNLAETHDDGHGTLKSYVIGFILSILLTVLPYAIVVHHLLVSDALVIAIVVLGVIQLLVQLIFFLHLSTHPSQRWNLITFAFTLLILVILVCGTLWIMWNMNYNMMDHAN